MVDNYLEGFFKRSRHNVNLHLFKNNFSVRAQKKGIKKGFALNPCIPDEGMLTSTRTGTTERSLVVERVDRRLSETSVENQQGNLGSLLLHSAVSPLWLLAPP